jgi:CBS domain containing-hemolysin-like protein
MTASKDLPVSELFERFHDEQQGLAFIQKNGRILVLVTLTDAIETIM